MRCEIELHAELSELHGYDRGHAAGGGRAGDGGERKLAACQEARRGIFGDDQIRLRENLQQVLLFERLDRRAQVEIGAEDKKVEKVREVDVGIRERPILKLKLRKERRLKLLC